MKFHTSLYILSSIFTFTPSICYGAAEPEIPLFDIIVGITTKRTRAEATMPENITAFEKIRELIGEYVENKKPVSAVSLMLNTTAGTRQHLDCYRDGILQTVAQHEIAPANIGLILGFDYHQRIYFLVNGASPYAPLLYKMPLAQAGIERALDPNHPGVWYVPGEIGTFLGLRCKKFDCEKANKEALKIYKKLLKHDQDLTLNYLCKPEISLTQRFARWTGLAKLSPSTPDTNCDGGVAEPAAPALYDPQIPPILPPEILNIVFRLLRKNATKQYTFIVMEDGIGALPCNRPPLETEPIACILGETMYRHKHGIFSDPERWQGHFTAQGKGRLENELLSCEQRSDEELATIAGTPDATFLVPSLAELLVTGKLTQKFYNRHKKLIERDLLDKADFDPAELDPEAKDDGQDVGHKPTGTGKNKRRNSGCRQQ